MPDILIRMDMPQHCFNCSTKIDPDNRKCNIDGHIFEETLSKLTCRRDEDCPLHELPPHGDLIDRNRAFRMMLDRGYQKEAAGVILEVPSVIPSNKGETP